MKLMRLFQIIGIAFILIGCIPSQRQNFQPNSTQHINKIALLTIENRVPYDNVDFAGPEGIQGILFSGLANGIATGQHRKSLFQDYMGKTDFDFSKSLSTKLKESLSTAGYEVKDISFKKNTEKFDQKQFIELSGDADAFLDIVVVFVGYNCKDLIFKRFYKPRIIVHANLYESVSGKLLYSELINYGEKSTSNCKHIPVSDIYQFEKFGPLLEHIELFRMGMEEGVNNIALQISHDLSKSL